MIYGLVWKGYRRPVPLSASAGRIRQTDESLLAHHAPTWRIRSLPLLSSLLLLLSFSSLITGCRGGPVGQLQARIDLKRGNESYLRGDFKIAIQHYDAALRHHPRHALANLHRAYSYLTLFRMTTDAEERRRTSNEAVRSFEQFLALRKSKSSYSERIEEHILTLYLDSDQPEKAVAFLEERLKKNPKDLPALQMLSNIKSDLGDVEGALQLFEKRIEIAPENPEAHHSLAVFAWSVSYNAREPDSLRAQAILDEGLKAAQEAMRLKPNYFEAITYANLLYREKAKHTDNSLLRREYESRADSLRNKAMKIHQTS